jgi:hypothetical protein
MSDLVTLTQTERVVSTNEAGTVVVTPQNTGTLVITGVMGPPGSTSINNATDVDVSQLTDGSTLVYLQSAAKWQATTLLEKQVMNGGFF